MNTKKNSLRMFQTTSLGVWGATLLLLILFTTACRKQALNLPANSENNLNLNSLLTLKIGENTIYTQDFILNPVEIDSVSSTEIPVALTDKNYKIQLVVKPETSNFFNINVWIKGVPYAIPCQKSDKVDYLFSFDPQG